MSKNTYLASLFGFLCCLTSCGESSIPEISSKRKTTNIEATEVGGVKTATIKPSVTTDQTLVAGSSAKIADAWVTFPPGALTLETPISIGEADDKSAAIMTDVGLTTVVAKKTTPVFIGSQTGEVVLAASQSLAIGLPLPLSEGALGLTAEGGKLVFLYAINTTEGWKSGIKPLTAADLVGTFFKANVKGLGYFQIAYLADKVEAKEVDSQIRPAIKKE